MDPIKVAELRVAQREDEMFQAAAVWAKVHSPAMRDNLKRAARLYINAVHQLGRVTKRAREMAK